MIIWYCCDIREAKDLSAVFHGPEKQHSCIRCHSTYENMVIGRGSSNRVVAETIEMRRRVRNLQEKAGRLAGRAVVADGKSY